MPRKGLKKKKERRESQAEHVIISGWKGVLTKRTKLQQVCGLPVECCLSSVHRAPAPSSIPYELDTMVLLTILAPRSSLRPHPAFTHLRGTDRLTRFSLEESFMLTPQARSGLGKVSDQPSCVQFLNRDPEGDKYTADE